MSIYKAEKVTKNITRIIMPYVCFYYVEGTERGLLIDNGWGYDDLRPVIDEIATKEYDVLLTHGHPDHAGATNQFSDKRVYLNHKDQKMFDRSCSKPTRRFLLKNHFEKHAMDFDRDLMSPIYQGGFTDLSDGQVFDLGSYTLELIEVPGHTPGIMTVLFKEDRLLLAGDACFNPISLNNQSSLSVESLYESIPKLFPYLRDVDLVLTNHNGYDAPIDVVYASHYLAGEILKGNDDKVRIKEDSNWLIARHKDQSKLSDIAETANIYYYPNRIYKSEE